MPTINEQIAEMGEAFKGLWSVFTYQEGVRIMKFAATMQVKDLTFDVNYKDTPEEAMTEILSLWRDLK